MTTGSPQPGETVVRAAPSRHWGGWVSLIPTWVAMAVGILLFASVSWLVILTALMLGGVLLARVFERHVRGGVLAFNEDGVVVRPASIWRLRGKTVSFRWDEVEQVGRGIFVRHDFLKVRLNRQRRFWTFRRQPPREVLLPREWWTDERFIEALRHHVPPENISLDALEAGHLPVWVRPTFGTILLACFAAVAVTIVLMLSESPVSGFAAMVTILACCFVGWAACSGALGADSTVGGAVAGALSACALIQLPLFLYALLGGGLRVLVAGLGAATSLLLGAALIVFAGERVRGYHVGLFYVLGIVGFAVGWLGYDGIPSKRVGEGGILLYAWTADGDGFVTQRSLEDAEETVLQWYSADGEPERAVTLPAKGFVCAVGRDVALFRVRGEDEGQVYTLPRRGGGVRLLASAYAVADVRVSPNGRRCVVATREEDGGPLLVATLPLPDGEIEQHPLPPGHEDAENVGILDDGRLVWTIGERPIRPDGGRTSHDAEIPPREMWPSIEERVDVWAWDPAKEGEPVRIYDAQQVWLDWRMPPTSDRLFVCRVVEDATPRREFVELVLTGEHPEVRPTWEDRFSSRNAVSPDGRFAVRDIEGTFPVQTRVYDAETGESRRLRETALFGMDRLLWSPTGHRFLYTTLESRFFRLRWRGTIADEEARLVVRLVDLGE